MWDSTAHTHALTSALVRVQTLSLSLSLNCRQEYRGDYGKTKDELVEWHRARFAFFVECPGADFLVCETIPSLVEVEAFVQLLNEYPSAHAMLAVACRSESELNTGEPIAHLTPVLAQLKNPSQLLAGAFVYITWPCVSRSLTHSVDCCCSSHSRHQLHASSVRRGAAPELGRRVPQGRVPKQRRVLGWRSEAVAPGHDHGLAQLLGRVPPQVARSWRPCVWRLLPHVSRRHQRHARAL